MTMSSCTFRTGDDKIVYCASGSVIKLYIQILQSPCSQLKQLLGQEHELHNVQKVC